MKELDELMDREATTYTNEDIEVIIRYVRQQLGMYESSGKKAKPKVDLDVDTLIAAMTGTKAPAPKPKTKLLRRF